MYQAYPIGLQRAPERFDFFQALVGDLILPDEEQFGPALPIIRYSGLKGYRTIRIISAAA